MPILEIEVEVYCSCGAHLCNQSSSRTSHNRGAQQIVVEPCSRCASASYDTGYDEGYDKGYGEAEDRNNNA